MPFASGIYQNPLCASAPLREKLFSAALSFAGLALLCAAALFQPAYSRASEPAGSDRAGTARYVAVGHDGRTLYSADGEHWAPAASAGSAPLFNVAFGLGRFIAVGGTPDAGQILSSRDAKSWQPNTAPGGRIHSIAFGLNRFVANRAGQLLHSSDGESFAPGDKLKFQGAIQPRRCAFGSGEAGPRFVFIGDLELPDATTSVSWRAATESGQSYTAQELHTAPASDIVYGAGHFVVVGPNGLIESSHDGQIWQRRRIDSTADFSRVLWTGRRFLVCGAAKIWSSTDGVDWLATELAPPPGTLLWADESDKTRALSQSSDGTLQFSSDLVTWRKLPLPPGPLLEAVTGSER